jgi:hypothetical protein
MNPNQNNINSVQVNFPTVNPTGGNLYPTLNPSAPQGGFGNANVNPNNFGSFNFDNTGANINNSYQPLNSPIAQLGLTYGSGYFNQQQQRLQNTVRILSILDEVLENAVISI